MDLGEKHVPTIDISEMYFLKKNAGRLSKICVRKMIASGKNWHRGAVAKKGEKNDTDFCCEKDCIHQH